MDNNNKENNNNNNEQLSTKEAYDLKKQKKDEGRERTEGTKAAKGVFRKVFLWVIVLGVLALIVWGIARSPKTPPEEIISRNGIHWHPELSITISGEEQEIPGNIGLLGAAHNPIHTHDPDGVIHLEISGVVRKNDTRLSQFFKVWKKEFSSECIFEYCNGPDGNMKMFVNGEENFEFENYLMQDEDKIEIRYE